MNPPNTLELLHHMVATPSVSGNEAAACAFLAGWFQDHGITPEIRDDNLILRIKGDAPGPTLLLNSHLDTVPAKEGWETDPWTPEVIDGRMFGLGSGDAKASVCAMATAALKIAQQGLPRGELIFAATVLEETGGGGLEYVRPTLGKLDAAMVGEPTGLAGAVAQSGLMILEAMAHGRTSHAARSHQGINALNIAARDLLALDAMELDREHPFLGHSSANVTVIKGGDRHNVIPDRCGFTIDIRYTPSYTPQELLSMMDAITQSTLSIRSTRLAPVETDPDSAIVKALLNHAPKTLLFGSPTMSDWVHLRGVPTLKIGPGQSELSHTPNESVELAQVTRAVDLYTQTATQFLATCGEPS